MKVLGLAVCTCALALSVSAAETPTNSEQDKTAQREAFLMKSGGFVPNKLKSTGKIAVVNLQKLVKNEDLVSFASDAEDALWFKIEVSDQEGEMNNVADIPVLAAKGGGNLSVLVVNESNPATITYYPEWKACVVNVGPLAAGVDAEKLKTRIRKELSRAICFVLQMPYAEASGGVFDPITSLNALDKIMVDSVGGEQRMNAARYADRFGIEGFKRTTYRRACEDGVAEKPKNKYQQHVWDEVHKMPTKPITIEPEKTPVKK